MPESLTDLEQQRAAVLRQISDLEDFPPGRSPEPVAAAVIRAAIVIAMVIPVTGRIRD